MIVYTGSGGLGVALALYGPQVIRNAGDYYTPCALDIPDEDVAAFNELANDAEKDAQSRAIRRGRS